MGVRTIQSAFGGEVSPSLYGRVDNPKYKTGLAVCRNFICRPQGPAQNRRGFAFVRAAKYSDRPCRLIPFEFSNSDTMVLEFGDKYIRFHTQEATLLNSEGNPYEISTPYSSDDIFKIRFCQSADVLTLTHGNYPPSELRRYGTYDWRLETIDFSPDLTAPVITGVTYVANGNTSENRFLYKYIVTALKDTDEGTVESASSAPYSVQCNLYWDDSLNKITWSPVTGAQRYRVYKSRAGIYGYIGETEDTSFEDNNIAADEGTTPPRWDSSLWETSGAITSVSVVNGGSGYANLGRIASVKVSPVINSTYPFFKNTAVNNGVSQAYPDYPAVTAKLLDASGSGSGAEVKVITSQSRTYTKYEDDRVTEYTWASFTDVKGIEVTSPGAGYLKPYIQFYKDGKEVSNFDSWYPIPETPTGNLITVETANTYDVVLNVTDKTGTGAQLKATVVDGAVSSVRIVSGGSGYTSPVITADSPTGTGATFSVTLGKGGDYPGAVTYYEQRRCFGGTPIRPQMLWMTRPGTETDMSYTIPVQDDNRIKFRISAQRVSLVKHLCPLSQLLVLTESSIFRVSPQNSDAITPSSVSVKPQVNSVGASDVTPILVGSNLVFTEARSGHVMELGYEWSRGGFTCGDVSVMAPHFFEKARAVDSAYMASPDPIIWYALSDGTLLGLTYMPEQQVAAFHRHDTAGGAFESVCCVAEGNEDALYAVVRRTVNGSTVRYIERMRETVYDSLENCFFVDSGATYEGPETRTLSGLNHLEGCEVAVLADGAVLPRETVKDGKIEIEVPAEKIQVGLPITSELKTLPLAVGIQDGSMGRGHTKNINQVWLQVYQSSGIFVGPSFDDLVEIKQRFQEPYGTAPEPISDQVDAVLPGRWTDTGQICLRQEDPLPLMIVGICAELAV